MVGGHGGGELLSSVGAVRADLDVVRLRGAHHVSEDAVPALVALLRAQRPDSGMPLADDLSRLLADVIASWGDGDASRAARCTFGLTSATRLKNATVRRAKAAEAMAVSTEHFRKTGERDLLDEVAAGLVVGRPPPVRVPLPREPTAGEVRLSTLDDEVEYSLRALLEGARTVLVQGKNWINLFNLQSARLAEVVRRGGTVRVLLVPPDPALGAGLYRADAAASGQVLVDNVNSALARVADLHAELGADARRLELRYAQIVPQYGFIASGVGDEEVERGVVQISFAHTRKGADRFVLCLPSGPELDGFVAEFEAAWRTGRTEARPT